MRFDQLSYFSILLNKMSGLSQIDARRQQNFIQEANTYLLLGNHHIIKFF